MYTSNIKLGAGIVFTDSYYMKTEKNKNTTYYEMETYYSCEHPEREGHKHCPMCGKLVHEQPTRHWLINVDMEIEEIFGKLALIDPTLVMESVTRKGKYTIFIGHAIRTWDITGHLFERIRPKLFDFNHDKLKELLISEFGERLVNSNFGIHLVKTDW